MSNNSGDTRMDKAANGIILAFPILAGKVEAWRRFCQELAGSRHRQYETSRQHSGITHERMTLVENPFGATAVTILESPDIAKTLENLITSESSFDLWYRQRLRELHGVNLSGFEQYSQPRRQSQNQRVYFEWNSDATDDGDIANPTFLIPGKEI